MEEEEERRVGDEMRRERNKSTRNFFLMYAAAFNERIQHTNDTILECGWGLVWSSVINPELWSSSHGWWMRCIMSNRCSSTWKMIHWKRKNGHDTYTLIYKYMYIYTRIHKCLYTHTHSRYLSPLFFQLEGGDHPSVLQQEKRGRKWALSIVAK